jgi:hypothetical protein
VEMGHNRHGLSFSFDHAFGEESDRRFSAYD